VWQRSAALMRPQLIPQGERTRPRLQRLVALIFEHRLDLLAQFRRVLVSVRRDGMLHRRIEHLLFRAGDFERAIFLARIISAVD